MDTSDDPMAQPVDGKALGAGLAGLVIRELRRHRELEMEFQSVMNDVGQWAMHIDERRWVWQTESGSVYVLQDSQGSWTLRQLKGDTLERCSGEWYPFYDLLAIASEVRTGDLRMKVKNQVVSEPITIRSNRLENFASA